MAKYPDKCIAAYDCEIVAVADTYAKAFRIVDELDIPLLVERRKESGNSGFKESERALEENGRLGESVTSA